jgi:hypothetical protein
MLKRRTFNKFTLSYLGFVLTSLLFLRKPQRENMRNATRSSSHEKMRINPLVQNALVRDTLPPLRRPL